MQIKFYLVIYVEGEFYPDWQHLGRTESFVTLFEKNGRIR